MPFLIRVEVGVGLDIPCVLHMLMIWDKLKLEADITSYSALRTSTCSLVQVSIVRLFL